MRHLLNTLYVLTPELYLTLDGENVVAKRDGAEAGRFPLHGLEQIVCFSYMGASPALMGKCAESRISLSFFSPNGKFLARSTGGVNGNVLLRRRQYMLSATPAESLAVARNMILGKVYNARWVLERALRDHALSIRADTVRVASLEMQQLLEAIRTCENMDSLRGLRVRPPVPITPYLMNSSFTRTQNSVLLPVTGDRHLIPSMRYYRLRTAFSRTTAPHLWRVSVLTPISV